MEPLESLYRRESGRMVAVLTRLFGVHNLALAEDVGPSVSAGGDAELTAASGFLSM